jgi:hypothetical protein
VRYARKLLPILLLLLTAASEAKRRDPLTEAEADQLRDVAMEPYKRLKLLVKFADARLVSIEQLRADPKEADGRGQKIHDLLEDFTSILDEVNDNLDQYAGRELTKDENKDFRKGIKETVSACDQFDLKLKTLRTEALSDPQTKKELSAFQFALQDAQDAIKSSLDVAKEYATDKNTDSTPKKP